MDSDDYAGQCLTEIACYMSLSAGQRISVAMTTDKIKSEIQMDSEYKYIRQVICGSVKIAKFVGDLSVYNYHRDNLTVTLAGIIMFKGSRFLLPRSLRPGLLKALHCGHAGVSGMIARAREVAWWPGISLDIESTRANCRVCHENAPSQAKEPAMGVLKTKFAYEALSIDHFYLKGVEYLAISDRHSGMLSVHATRHRGSKEYLKILRQHCVRNGIPVSIYTDGSSVFTSFEVKDFFERYNIKHYVSSVANAHGNLRAEVGVRILKRILRDIVTETGCLNSDAVTEALLIYHNTKCRVLGKSPSELANGRVLKDFLPRDISSLLPAPENLMTGVVKDKLQEGIRLAGGQKWSEHTKKLPPLEMGTWVQ